MAQRNVAEILAGAVVLLVAGGFLTYAVGHSGRSVTSGYPLHAAFDNISGLSVGSDVRIGGVKVGSVTDQHINPENYLAEVTLSISNAIKVPKDSSLEVTSDGLLGGKYLALSPGGDMATLPPGGAITITQSSISIESLLGRFIFSAGNLASSMNQQGGQTQGGQTQGGAAKPGSK